MILKRKTIQTLHLMFYLLTAIPGDSSLHIDTKPISVSKQTTKDLNKDQLFSRSIQKATDDIQANLNDDAKSTDSRPQPYKLAGLTRNQIVALLSKVSDSLHGDLKQLKSGANADAMHSPVRRSVPKLQTARLRKQTLGLTKDTQVSPQDNKMSAPVVSPATPGQETELPDNLAGLVSLHGNNLAGLTKDQVMNLLSSASAESMERSQHADYDGDDSASLHGDSEISKTCGIAMRAAEEAKAASAAQNSAGMQAAREVKLQLAEKAQRAANAAQAALSEKQNEMHMLEDQMHDAETVMLEEHDSLNQTRQNVDTAGKTVQNAKEQYKALELALKLSQETIVSAEALAQGAQHELNEKLKLMTAAKSKVSELGKELERAKKEYVNTRESAGRAAEAAKEALMNANKNSK